MPVIEIKLRVVTEGEVDPNKLAATIEDGLDFLRQSNGLADEADPGDVVAVHAEAMGLTALEGRLEAAFAHQFMKPQIVFQEWYVVETRDGTEVLPADRGHPPMHLGMEYEFDDGDDEIDEFVGRLRDFLEAPIERVLSVQLTEKWGARLSASGYMDCTPWSLFGTQAEAIEHLIDTYGDC